jgi:LAS superfamily LD-carboxypeptidase LdcB
MKHQAKQSLNLSTAQALGLEQTHLVEFETKTKAKQKFLIHPSIKQSLQQLLKVAHQDGVNIAIVSAYRSFDRQLAIWNAKWIGNKTVLSADNQALEPSRLSLIEKFKAICHFSALPGFSRHHWGTDLDIFCADAISSGHQVELTDREFGPKGPCNQLNLWLNDNLEKLGFYRPYLRYQQGVAAEPWHISHYQTSTQILKSFNQSECFNHLKSAEIKDPDFIQTQLANYYQQYFCNLCPPESDNLVKENKK